MRSLIQPFAWTLIMLAAPGCNLFGVIGDGEGAPCEVDEACPDGMRCVDGACSSGSGADDASLPDGTADAAAPDVAADDSASTQDAARPDASTPDTAVAADTASVDGAALDAATAGDAATLDAGAGGDAAVVDSAATDAIAAADSAGADAAMPDTLLPDTLLPDTAAPDTAASDAAAPDTLLPDTSLPDTLLSDTNLPDTLFCEDLDGDGHDAISGSCPGSDDNCDDDTNNWTTTGCSSCADADMDGYHSDECDRFSTIAGPDCDDSSVVVSPAGIELADDGIDNDCTGGDLTALGDVSGIFVDANNACPGAGDPNDPYCDLNDAIATVSVPFTNIYVREGYYGEIDVNHSVNIYGSYDQNDWTVSKASTRPSGILATTANTPAVMIQNSIQVLVYGFSAQGTSGGTKAVGVRNEGTLYLIDNFIVGNGPNTTQSIGVENVGTLFAMENLVRAGGNSATTMTRGYLIYAGAATLYNEEVYGGVSSSTNWAIIVSGGSLTAMNCYINGQFYGDTPEATAYNQALGISDVNADVLLLNSIIVSGDAPVDTAAIGHYSGKLTAVNNIIMSGAAASGFSTALIVDYTSAYDPNDPNDPYFDMETTLINNDLWGPSIDELIFVEASSILPDAIDDVNTCGWEHCVGSGGNISADPLLSTSAPFGLTSGSSPCADQGVDGSTYTTSTLIWGDMEGDVRPRGSGWDIGRDEY